MRVSAAAPFASSEEAQRSGCTDDSPIDSVTGWVAEDPFSDLDQSMGGVIHFANGITCFCHNEKVAKRGVEVTGTEGSFRTDLYTWFELETLEEGSTKLVTSWEGEPSVSFGHERDDAPNGIDAEGWQTIASRQTDSIAGVVDAVEGTIEEPRCTGDNLRKVLEIAIGFRESARRGGRPVAFPLRNRRLQLFPVQARLLNKKPIYGEEAYAGQMAGHKVA